ncbi:signal transduction histidine kinase/CheY-like chemotaxis protein [Pseudomonas sp. PvR086]|jgi:signal transduction histidine kinase/CheY-like chemotaxis protein|uniref:hybrid sensor histidine kinase/response regulator n=1 Tax=Pseudomonas TaxID=286 RepID=UPI000B362B15|nr:MULTISPECIES: hybrid sensor histidine kinase/response regulator [Pseudomonas]MBD9607482.1 response regulator [Pseudomonas sp. PDM08]MDR7107616.1 signal transduction histidine kinase/CheY-like chemotaxis protein [Pseudomonas frederiksbergensis]PMY50644.1 hybrid sensor histidine kinase/response regulator [Pseudomonas sp. FW305-53]PMY88424.1 hybrid sensor histidine kinase/response regulator [Pseudomonas sp. FW303-C2]PMY93635.1 hybrid sensor histidine kinase/response regulator [Pseudomonas sp. 
MRYLLMLLLCLPLLASAVEFDEFTQSLPLGRTMQVYEDPGGQATIADVRAQAAAGHFKPHDKATLNAGYSRSAFWLKIDLQYRPTNPSAQRTWLLELAYPPLDHLDLYLPDAGGDYQLVRQTGDALPFATREIRQNNYLFGLSFAPGQAQTVYLRLQSEGSIQAPVTLWSSTAYLEEQPVRLYVLGLIYGVLLGMLVYNLFIFLSVRDTSYLYYIVYIASFGLYQLSVNGAAVEYFWPNNPWWANAATPFFIGCSGLFGSQFARSFLRTATHSRWLDRVLLALIAFSTLVVGLSLMTSYALALRLATALALVFTVAIFAAGVFAWWRGLRVARYFIIAWSAFLLGGVVNTMMVLGYLPNVFLTMYASQIGSALEVALLSLALADRINAMREHQAQTLFDAGQKLEVLNQQLAHSNRLKDEFLATLTHELRTPMNGVIGSLELMQTVEMNPELEQYQQTAAGSARDMMRMVNGILTLTELQAGKLKVYPDTFSLRSMVESLRGQFDGNASSKSLDFKVEVAPGLPDRLFGDSGKLVQCLECLLDNAIKFTRVGGLALRVTGKPAAEPGRLALSFAVIDTGIGFTDLGEATLYQRFFQLDGSMTREYGGLGVGLAICRQLVELLGGRLSHRSEPGRGSRFQLDVEFELSLVEPAPSITRQTTGLRLPQECTVLLVDDNSINQLVMRGMLLKLGFRVRTADNGLAALDQLQCEAVDAVLLDCQLPPVDSASICRRIRALPGCAELPVFMIALSADRVHCPSDTVVDYLNKPVKFEDLQAALYRRVLCSGQGESADI